MAIYDSVTLVRAKTNKSEILKFIDLFFEKWELKNAWLNGILVGGDVANPGQISFLDW